MLDLVFLTKEDGLIMGPISRVLGWILNGIYEFLTLFTDDVNAIGMANIALCIILFTIVVKMLMLPLTIKQQKFYKLSAKDVDLQVPSCSFTSSVQDIFGTLLWMEFPEQLYRSSWQTMGRTSRR